MEMNRAIHKYIKDCQAEKNCLEIKRKNKTDSFLNNNPNKVNNITNILKVSIDINHFSNNIYA